MTDFESWWHSVDPDEIGEEPRAEVDWARAAWHARDATIAQLRDLVAELVEVSGLEPEQQALMREVGWRG